MQHWRRSVPVSQTACTKHNEKKLRLSTQPPKAALTGWNAHRKISSHRVNIKRKQIHSALQEFTGTLQLRVNFHL